MNTIILIVTLVGLAGGMAYTLIKPRWAFLFIVVLYPLEQLLTTVSTFFATNTKFLNLAVGGVAAFGAVSGIISGKAPFRGYFNVVYILTIALYAWSMLGVVYAPDKAKATADLILAIPYLGLMLILPTLLVNGLDEFRRLIPPILVVGSAIIGLILASPNTAMFSGRLGIEGLGDSAIQNPLATASLGGTILVMGMLYKPTKFALFMNIIRGGAITAGLAITMLSGSRGQLLAAVGSAVLLFPLARQIGNMVQFLAVSASGLIAMLFGMLVLQFVTTSEAATRWDAAALETGVDSRWQFIATIMGEYMSRPISYLQGLGTSAFTSYWHDDRIPYVHNMPAQVLSEHGLIGAALLIAIVLMTTVAGWKMLRLYRDHPEELSTAAILVSLCVYNMLLSFKQSNFFTSGLPFWVFLVLAKVSVRSMKDAAAYSLWAYQVEAYNRGEMAEEGGAVGAAG